MTVNRVDVAAGGGGWDNKLLRNYALAMRALDKLPISNPRSWKYLGAMHGFRSDIWMQAEVIDQDTVIPSSLIDGTFGDQCQHSTWFFLPWHRGYLFAFESIVAETVKELTGDDWALPYWNYLDDTNPDARKIPAAFTADKLWDGSENPFVTYPRENVILPAVPPQRDINLRAMEESDFVVGNDGTLGFGGGKTGFEHFGRMAGDLEVNPHNVVHGMVGGFMGHPYLAGLDPVFWLHHCNIDRLWEAWMSAPGKTMTRDQDWLDKPDPIGRVFMAPAAKEGDAPIRFTPRQTLRNGTLHRGYDDLTKGTSVMPGGGMVAHIQMGAPQNQRVELLGANEDRVEIALAPTRTVIATEAQVTNAAVKTMGASAPGVQTTRLYLALESIRGQAPFAIVDVYVNIPEDGNPEAHADHVAGSLQLFGLDRASDPDGGHAGNGLGQTLDITELAGRLVKSGKFDPENIKVTLVPIKGSSEVAPITIDRVSVLKRTGVVTPIAR